MWVSTSCWRSLAASCSSASTFSWKRYKHTKEITKCASEKEEGRTMTQHTGRTCSPYLNHGLLFSTWKSLGFPLGLFPLLHHLKANKGGKDEIKLIKTVNLLSSFYPSHGWHASEVLLLIGVKEKKKVWYRCSEYQQEGVSSDKNHRVWMLA